MHLIKQDNILIEDDKMTVYIVDLVKQTRPGRHIEPLTFHRYNNTKLCVINAIEQYQKRTANLRGPENRLFIACVKPFKAVTKSTISRWVKQLMTKAGININVFGTHSCRSASTSSLAFSGVPINNIMKSVGWKSASTFYKFYFKPIQKVQTLSDSILYNVE